MHDRLSQHVWNIDLSYFHAFLLLQMSEMKLTVDGLEKERDFYFSKLRDIEVLCQEHETEDLPVLKSIMDILYATEVPG